MLLLIKQMFQIFLVIMCEFFCPILCLLFIAWCYYSLFDIITLIVTICSMLLLLLPPLCLMFLAWHHYSLFDTIVPLATPCSTLLLLWLFLIRHCCSSCYSLFDGVVFCSTLLLLLLLLVQCCYSSCHSLFNIVVLLLPLVRHYCSFCYSLVNVNVLLVVPWSTLLLNVPWSMLLLLYLFIFDTAYSSTSMLCCDVDVPLLLIRCYCSYSSCFRLVFSPSIFCSYGKNSPNSNF